ncbi:MAG: 50S ribosomal protein L6 [Bdellovibrio sp.]|nr:MAG: 50S ribosomal protein L6 [Bdellovibrio sp.]
MSRIGRSPVYFDEKIQVNVTPKNEVVVKGPKGSLTIKLRPEVTAKVDGKKVILTRLAETKESRSLHGMYRALVQNAVSGLGKGFTRNLELHGVGYRANVAGKKLELSLGYSHPIVFNIPEGIEIKVDKQTSVAINGANRELVGQVAAKIRSFRPPEPYLGKGIRYADEVIRRKAGKSASK